MRGRWAGSIRVKCPCQGHCVPARACPKSVSSFAPSNCLREGGCRKGGGGKGGGGKGGLLTTLRVQAKSNTLL